jgi:hypothetical protein
MTGPGGSRAERILERALGALSDWLELVRQHENDRRARLQAEARARSGHQARVVMTILGAATLALFFWLSRP